MPTERERFYHTLCGANGGANDGTESKPGGAFDRPSLWEEGIRDDVLVEWRKQAGTSAEVFLKERILDNYHLAGINLEPIPPFPQNDAFRLADFSRRYRPSFRKRFPKRWNFRMKAMQPHSPFGMLLSRGTFLSLGVGNWKSLEKTLIAMADSPDAIENAMEFSTELSLWALDRVLVDATIDFAIVSEPIASFHGPVISPGYYRRFTIPHLVSIVERLRSADVNIVIAQAYGNVKPLISTWLDAGINTLRCSHAKQSGMDYLELRREYGTELRLIGGIDARALSAGEKAIDKELQANAIPLLEQGCYLPMLDDRIRPNVRFEDYLYYREQLERIAVSR